MPLPMRSNSFSESSCCAHWRGIVVVQALCPLLNSSSGPFQVLLVCREKLVQSRFGSTEKTQPLRCAADHKARSAARTSRQIPRSGALGCPRGSSSQRTCTSTSRENSGSHGRRSSRRTFTARVRAPSTARLVLSIPGQKGSPLYSAISAAHTGQQASGSIRASLWQPAISCQQAGRFLPEQSCN